MHTASFVMLRASDRNAMNPAQTNIGGNELCRFRIRRSRFYSEKAFAVNKCRHQRHEVSAWWICFKCLNMTWPMWNSRHIQEHYFQLNRLSGTFQGSFGQDLKRHAVYNIRYYNNCKKKQNNIYTWSAASAVSRLRLPKINFLRYMKKKNY